MRARTRLECGDDALESETPLSHPDVNPCLTQRQLVLGLVVGAHASAVELTKSNFDELVLNSGKGALVKFLAPW